MNQTEKAHWQSEDFLLDKENEQLLSLVHADQPAPTPTPSLDRKIRAMAHARIQISPDQHWIFGQGPRVILVTLIMFAIAMAVLLAF